MNKGTRQFEVSELIRKLCGIMTNEVRIVKRSQLADLEIYLLQARRGSISNTLQDYINEKLRVQDFLRPIIIDEAKKIILNTDPYQYEKTTDSKQRVGGSSQNNIVTPFTLKSNLSGKPESSRNVMQM